MNPICTARLTVLAEPVLSTVFSQERTLYGRDSFGIEVENTSYTPNSTTIDLRLWLFPPALFRNFARLCPMQKANDAFVTCDNSNTQLRRAHSAPVSRSNRIICDWKAPLKDTSSRNDYREYLRRIRFKDSRLDTGIPYPQLHLAFDHPLRALQA